MALAVKKLEDFLPASFTVPGLSEDGFFELCQEFPEDMVEYWLDGTVIVAPPTDPESSERIGEVYVQLNVWARGQGQGRTSGPDGSFRLPDGSRLSPDSAWFDAKRWASAKEKEPCRRYPVFAPEFVIEIRSPDDRVRKLQEKMEIYIANGVKLAWLIDPIERTVTIYRPNRRPKVLSNPASVEGEGPVAGFVLDLTHVIGA